MPVESTHNILTLVLGSFAIFWIGNVIWNIFFHALRKYPGPLIGRATVLYYHVRYLLGHLPNDFHTLHSRHGPVVRVAPNQLSFISSRAWGDIYEWRREGRSAPEMAKHRMFQSLGPNTPATIFTADLRRHDQLRHKLAPCLSEAAIRLYEPNLQEYTSLLIQRLAANSQNGTQAINRNSAYDSWVKAVSFCAKEAAILHVSFALGLRRIIHTIAGKALLARLQEHENSTQQKLDVRLKTKVDPPDMVEALLTVADPPLSKSEMLQNTSLLIIAASDTTSSHLTGVFYHLVQNPEALRKATQEVRSYFCHGKDITVASTAKLTYLKACLDEALRLFPPVPMGVPRVVPKEGAMIAGHPVPGSAPVLREITQTIVSVPHWAAYHSEINFFEPFEFRPERFLGDVRYSSDDLCALQPFSFGNRNCIGRAMSNRGSCSLVNAQSRVVMAKILYTFNLQTAPENDGWLDRVKSYILPDKPSLYVYFQPVPDFDE
ncbi:cytochrome P450 ClCP1 [Metarhizium acridum CQMa 102]|uniref:Cytochrome P450 ClCP1 n=1 Tax=Metarhizium acridum (strain CQMa 102) TaxID=655827 RepID=E9E5P1_METAQ|nr:cytochrome P450 ClCP1 [Metarhizium acridum CQMa 102]EFY88754.1 cytochrome P450 ClCP1 [Metarhizium acridum CQMa 102]